MSSEGVEIAERGFERRERRGAEFLPATFVGSPSPRNMKHPRTASYEYTDVCWSLSSCASQYVARSGLGR